MEIWKDILGYEGFYQVSNLGNVKSLERKVLINGNTSLIKERILKNQKDTKGYLFINMSKNGKGKRSLLHQLVAITFLNHKPDGTHKIVINHIDHNKYNNNLNNLELVSQRENANKKHVKSTSKYTGVSLIKSNGKWLSTIRIGSKSKYLGTYKNEYDAHLAYEKALKEILNQSEIKP